MNKLLLEVNSGGATDLAKRKAAPLKQYAFLGFQIGWPVAYVGRAVWTTKAHAHFKRRVREITRRNREHRIQDVID